MTDARLVRAAKLLALRERELEHAKNNLALAVATTHQAKLAAENGEHEWHEALERPPPGLETLADHENHHQHLHCLRAAVERLHARAVDASKHEDIARQAVTHATTEHKKVELWHHSIVDAVNEDERRKDAKSNDEMAARRNRERVQEQ